MPTPETRRKMERKGHLLDSVTAIANDRKALTIRKRLGDGFYAYRIFRVPRTPSKLEKFLLSISG